MKDALTIASGGKIYRSSFQRTRLVMMRLYSSGVAIAARIAGDMRDAMKEAGNSR
jgi:hypothetical protein